MNVLIVGGGAREHALAHSVANSPQLDRLVVAPGNPGTEELPRTTNRPDVAAADVAGQVALAREIGADLVIVGPEQPLTAGLPDRLRAAGIPTFGPGQRGAQIEGSKAWAKELMRKHAIPTADHRTFHNFARASAFLETAALPIVIKADGLAAGKGVVVAREREQALAALRRMMVQKEFGEAGARVVFEDFLVGPEVSVLAVTDGDAILPLPAAQDHKPVYDDDRGPNTGGMGAYSPVPTFTPSLTEQVDRKILVPIVHALRKESIEYRGVIYAGLMLTKTGPRVIEFNARFGDPEAQAVLPRLTGDVLPVLHAAATGTLGAVDPAILAVDERPAVSVVLASGGYPGNYEIGHVIEGVEAAKAMEDVIVYHAGTARDDSGRLVTAGGRVLSIVGRGASLAEARDRAYSAAEGIRFAHRHMRSDIARRAVEASA